MRLSESFLEFIGHEEALIALHYVGDGNALYPHRLGRKMLIAVSLSAAWSGLVFARGFSKQPVLVVLWGLCLCVFADVCMSRLGIFRS